MDWLNNLLSEPGIAFPLLVIFMTVGIPSLCWAIIALVSVLVKHRERIAMIEQGIDPDAHTQK